MRSHAPIRVLLVDDHRPVADAIERLVSQEGDMVVVGTVGAVS